MSAVDFSDIRINLNALNINSENEITPITKTILGLGPQLHHQACGPLNVYPWLCLNPTVYLLIFVQRLTALANEINTPTTIARASGSVPNGLFDLELQIAIPAMSDIIGRIYRGWRVSPTGMELKVSETISNSATNAINANTTR